MNIEHIINLAKLNKNLSTCLSRKVVAVIYTNTEVLSIGVNKVPENIKSCSEIGKCKRRELGFDHGECLHLCRAEHAESNAINQCAKLGVSCKGATIYINTPPCPSCVRRILDAGITKIIYSGDYPQPIRGQGLLLAQEAGLEVIYYV